MKKGYRILKILSVIFIIYGLIVLFLIGPYHIFNFFYLLGGLFLFLLCRFHETIRNKVGKRIWSCFVIVLLLLGFSFLYMETKIVLFSLKEPKANCEYVLVLGSQIKEDGPSIDYQARLDSAYEYLMENQKAIVICCGGKGKYEPISEAKGGRDYLMTKGIDEKRILMEDKSVNTVENISNAMKLMNKDGKVLLVSADYHLYRAAYIAKKLGLADVSCKGGHGLWILLPQYYSREFFALWKEYLTL